VHRKEESTVTLQQAAEKWNRNTQGKAQKWYQNTTAAGSTAYCAGLAKLGIPTGACQSGPGARFAQGVQAAGAQAFQAGINGKEGKWMTDFANAFNS
jgi:hypothetical protein